MAAKASPEKLFGIVGFPLGHSLSPLLFNNVFPSIDIPAVYMRWEIPPNRLEDMIGAVRTLPVSGMSVTIPHKENIIHYLDGVTPTAGRIGAVNTLFWKDGKLLGENTDVIGFIDPLEGAFIPSALVLGAGGAARGVLAGLRDLGVKSIAIANRSESRARILARDFGVDVLPWEERTNSQARLLVNCTPLGMKGDMEELSPWPADSFGKECIAYDLVYNPIRTRFLREAEKAGCQIIDGLEMFIAQAAAQCRIWTQKELPADESRELLVNVLNS